MLSEALHVHRAGFRTAEEVRPAIERLCADHPEAARFEVIGNSEQGREIGAVVLGRGPRRVSLVAGAHADEPVGPETLRLLALEGIKRRQELAGLFERFTFAIVPHVNPDGEAANRAWTRRWPDPLAYLSRAVREPPGRDVEFGYPDPERGLPALRAENEAVAAFLERFAAGGGIDLHLSLHGMAVAEGAWLLIERRWVDRTAELRRRWLEAIGAAGLRPFDWDRGGEKGFEYIGPGFSTTPRGEAMRAHFERQGDAAAAAAFRHSSMEYARSLGGDPLCLVTELPLFVLRGDVGGAAPGVPAAYLRFREVLPRLRQLVERGGPLEEIVELVEPFEIEPLDLDAAIGLQLRAIELGLEQVGEAA